MLSVARQSEIPSRASGVAGRLPPGPVTLAVIELVLHWLIDLGKGEGLYGYVADQALHLACKVAYVIILANGIQLV